MVNIAKLTEEQKYYLTTEYARFRGKPLTVGNYNRLKTKREVQK